MSDTLVLNPHNVVEIFEDCLFRDGEDTTDHIVAEGIMMKAGFNPTRLNAHQPEIEAMLAELPDDYRESGGGGMSFLNACMDRHGNQWTGMHQTMDQLFILGIAIGKAHYLMDREMWSAFPGGVPYVSVSV
ncbi:hypothetical protein H0W80_05260 [Candidatus Saccharibacteria bacterium]|nr:hypothetical protein [Candidatus Saccharibacteria bacterium]